MIKLIGTKSPSRLKEIQSIIDSGAVLEDYLLLRCIKTHDCEAFKILKNHIKVPRQFFIEAIGAGAIHIIVEMEKDVIVGEDLLDAAFKRGNMTVAANLMSKVDSCEKNYFFELTRQYYKKTPELIDMFLSFGMDLHALNEDGKDLFTVAIEKSMVQLVADLMQHPVNIRGHELKLREMVEMYSKYPMRSECASRIEQLIEKRLLEDTIQVAVRSKPQKI